VIYLLLNFAFWHFITNQLELSVEYMIETRHNSWENLTHKRIFHQLHFALPNKQNTTDNLIKIAAYLRYNLLFDYGGYGLLPSMKWKVIVTISSINICCVLLLISKLLEWLVCHLICTQFRRTFQIQKHFLSPLPII